MKLNNLYFIFILILLSNTCFPTDPPPTLKPYDPQKAGAKIIASYDLTNIIGYTYKVSDYTVHFSEYENKLYFIHNKKIHIVDKENMLKIREISFDIKTYYPDIDPDYNYYYNLDLAISNNKILFSYYMGLKNNTYKTSIFSLDLSGDNFKEMDASNDLGLQNSPGHMGNDRINNYIWFQVSNNIYNFKYYYDTNNYQMISSWKITRGCEEFCIEGDSFWFSYLYSTWTQEFYIENYNKNNQSELLKKINTSYLGTNAIPNDILFHDPYLWIIINKDDKMQLLKLKPL